MNPIFPVEGIFSFCFNPETRKFQKLSMSVKGHAIGTSSQSELTEDGTTIVQACFVVQGRTSEGHLMHWIVKVHDFSPSEKSTAPGKFSFG